MKEKQKKKREKRKEKYFVRNSRWNQLCVPASDLNEMSTCYI